jgi:hypothetical protein
MKTFLGRFRVVRELVQASTAMENSAVGKTGRLDGCTGRNSTAFGADFTTGFTNELHDRFTNELQVLGCRRVPENVQTRTTTLPINMRRRVVRSMSYLVQTE